MHNRHRMTPMKLNRMFLSLVAAIAVTLASDAPASADSRHEEPISRLLFGSCIKQDQPMPIFRTIEQEPAQLLIFLGDNIYADTNNMAVMKSKYEKLAANGDFQAARQKFPALATWDDHDFGINDGGAEYQRRAESQQLFVDFWELPTDSPLRRRPGVYDAYRFGPEGKQVQIILLDTRYFRSPLKRGERRDGGPYIPDENPEKTMLGEPQWQWLKEQLRIPADVRIIASSIQCVAEAAGQETWSNLPRERDRLFQLIHDTAAEGVLIISGDRHWAELSVEPDAAGYPIHDLTSSSFNQIHPRGTPTPNRYRAINTTYHRENYGAISINWSQPDPEITLEIHDLEGNVQIEKHVQLSELKPPNPNRD